MSSNARHHSSDVAEIDLVMGSVGRFKYVDRFLQSLGAAGPTVRVIIVEQRDPSGLEDVVARHRDRGLWIEVLHSQPGLSLARNRALEIVRAPVVAFPDDDCWYLPETVPAALRALASADVVIGEQRDDDGSRSIRSLGAATVVGRRNVWRVGMSSAIFARRNVFDRIGGFDPGLGVGSKGPRRAGEETDFLLRAIGSDLRVWYEPEVQIGHPSRKDSHSGLDPELGYGYGYGMGFVMRRHRYSLVAVGYRVLRPALGAAVAKFSGREELASFRWKVSLGRARGWSRSSEDSFEKPQLS